MSKDKTVYEGQIRERLAGNGEHSKILLRRFSAELFDSIQRALREQGQLRLHQFGSFKLQWTKERRGRHPQTGESIIIPAHPRIVFTPAKALKQQVNEARHAPASDRPDIISSRLETVPVIGAERPQAVIERTHPQALANDRAPEPRTGVQLQALAAVIAMGITGLLMFYGTMETEQNPMTDIETRQPAQPPAPAQGTQPQSAPQPSVTTLETQRSLSTETEPAVASAELRPAATEPAPWFEQRAHKLKNGDSLWRLSDKQYLNPFYWPHIYQANRDDINNPNKLIMGRTILLPTLQGRPGQLTAADRRRIAEGYFLVYLYYKKKDRPYPYYALLGANRFDPAVIRDNIDEIDAKDWENLQLASN